MAPVQVQKGWECREGGEAGEEGQTPICDIKNQISAVPYQQLFTPNYPRIMSEHGSGRYWDNLRFIKVKRVQRKKKKRKKKEKIHPTAPVQDLPCGGIVFSQIKHSSSPHMAPQSLTSCIISAPATSQLHRSSLEQPRAELPVTKLLTKSKTTGPSGSRERHRA